jgi:hypothetical protein
MILRCLSAIFFTFSLFAADITTSSDEVQKILDHQKNLFNAFLPCGFSDYEELRQQIENKYPEKVRQFDEKVVLALFAPSSIRKKIFTEGFKNFYETGCSNGLKDTSARFNTEQSLLNYSSYDYKNISISLRPKYGIIATRRQVISLLNNDFFYGDDVYIFNLDNIKNNVTWTPGDSLNLTSAKGKNCLHECRSWDEIFIPWSYRHILIPYLDADISTIKLSNKCGENNKLELDNIYGSKNSFDYVEFQIWGNVDISAVEHFIYKNFPPTKEIEKKIKKHHIYSCSSKQYESATSKCKKYLVTIKEKIRSF